jgi:hypothetical protein
MSGTLDELFQRNETASVMTEDQLLRNAFDKVGVDGTGAQGSMHHDALAAAVNTAQAHIIPSRSRILTVSGTAATLLIRGQTGKTILVFDLFCSISAASNVSFLTENGVTILFPTFHATAAGQGFCFNSSHGFPMLMGKSLYVKSSAAVTLEIGASFVIV